MALSRAPEMNAEIGRSIISSAICFIFRAKDAILRKELVFRAQETAIRKKLQNDPAEDNAAGCLLQEFVPYYSKSAWHSGAKAFVSKLFPRYGNYCGPNWSSGRDGGSALWDKPPLDRLDFCCYKHDIGYNSHSQLDLYKADLALCRCLLSIPASSIVGDMYKSACIFGLKMILVPYRRLLLRRMESVSLRENKLDNLQPSNTI